MTRKRPQKRFLRQNRVSPKFLDRSHQSSLATIRTSPSTDFAVNCSDLENVVASSLIFPENTVLNCRSTTLPPPSSLQACAASEYADDAAPFPTSSTSITATSRFSSSSLTGIVESRVQNSVVIREFIYPVRPGVPRCGIECFSPRLIDRKSIRKRPVPNAVGKLYPLQEPP